MKPSPPVPAARRWPQVRKVPPDVVVSDLKMAGMDGIELMGALPQSPAPPVIIVTAHGTIDSAVEAVKLGAFDYLTKPLDKQKILMAVRKACERAEILKENARLKKELFARFRMEGIIARSARMRETVEVLKRVADSPATVMVLGESGTGKELVARAIHYNSPRRNKPFTAINCAAIRRPCSKASCSVTSRGPLPAPPAAGPGCSKSATAAPSFSTRSATCRC